MKWIKKIWRDVALYDAKKWVLMLWIILGIPLIMIYTLVVITMVPDVMMNHEFLDFGIVVIFWLLVVVFWLQLIVNYKSKKKQDTIRLR